MLPQLSNAATFARRSSLPHLPVPSLSSTCAKWLKSVRPFFHDNSLDESRARALIDDLLQPGGVGERAQAALEHKAATEENWLTDWWEKYAYLAHRGPLPPVESSQTLMPARSGTPLADGGLPRLAQLQRAASLVAALRAMYGEVHAETMCPDAIPMRSASGKRHLLPACMAQYRNLFRSSRIPGQVVDTSSRLFATASEEEHLPPHERYKPFVIVAFNGRFYQLFTDTIDGVPQSLSQLEREFEQLHQRGVDAGVAPLAEQVGWLPAAPRAEWAAVRAAMIAHSPRNAESFDTLCNALCVIALDTNAPVGDAERYVAAAAGCVLSA